MSQYTRQIQEILQIIEYLEHSDSANAIEAHNGKFITYYNHGGTEIKFLRDTVHNDIEYKKGDIVYTDPLDQLYIQYKQQYANQKPIFKTIKMFVHRVIKTCLTLK